MGTSHFGWNTEETTKGSLLLKQGRLASGKGYVWSVFPPTRQNILKRLCLMCFLSDKAEYQLEALVRYAEMNIWSWTTGNIMIVTVPGVVKIIMILLLLMVVFVMVMLMLIIMAIMMQELGWSTILIDSSSETWSCCSTSLTLTLGKLFQLRRQISVRNSSDFLTLRLREQKIMVLLKLMCLKLNTTTSCTRSKAEKNINGQTRRCWSHSKEAWPFFREFWTKHELWHEWITWQSPGAGKKTVIIFFSFELSKSSKLKFRAMQYSNIDSETENGSSAKRHLGGGRDIHLKMLIPRCLLPTCWSWEKRNSVVSSETDVLCSVQYLVRSWSLNFILQQCLWPHHRKRGRDNRRASKIFVHQHYDEQGQWTLPRDTGAQHFQYHVITYVWWLKSLHSGLDLSHFLQTLALGTISQLDHH